MKKEEGRLMKEDTRMKKEDRRRGFHLLSEAISVVERRSYGGKNQERKGSDCLSKGF